MKRTFIILLFVMVTVASFAQSRFALRNNLLYDLTLTPNLSADFRVAPHWTVGGTIGYNPWWHHADTRSHAIFLRGNSAGENDVIQWRHLLVMPEARYWFFKQKSEGTGVVSPQGKGSSDGYDGHSFIGFNLLYSHYNVGNVRFPFGMYKSVRSKRRQGDAYGVGVSVGRVWHLTGPLYLEAELGVDAGITNFDNFICSRCGAQLSSDTKPFVVPKAGLSLVLAPGKKALPVQPVVPPVKIDTVVTPPFEPVLAMVPEFGGVADELAKKYPVLQQMSSYRPYEKTHILRKEPGALYVHFPTGKADLRRDYRDNASVLDQITEITRLIMADTTSSVVCIQVVGLSSVEGPLAQNEKLSVRRAKALQAYVQQQVDVPTSLFETIGGGEAWAEFRSQIEDEIARTQNADLSTTKGRNIAKELEEVLRVIDLTADFDKREQKIRKMNGGRTYQYIKKNLLADQRNSGYIRIYWNHKPDVKAQLINRASEQVQQSNYAEALRLLNEVKDDPRCYNTLGVALYQSGRKTEALRYFRMAAEAGNAQAQQNLEQIRHLK